MPTENGKFYAMHTIICREKGAWNVFNPLQTMLLQGANNHNKSWYNMSRHF